jgi:hypothetical protein
MSAPHHGMFASRSAPVKFLVLRVTLETVKTPVAIMPIAIFGYKFINEMINEDENFTKNVFDFYLTYLYGPRA